MWPNPQETLDLVTFAEEIFNGKLHFCAVNVLVARFSEKWEISSCSNNANWYWELKLTMKQGCFTFRYKTSLHGGNKEKKEQLSKSVVIQQLVFWLEGRKKRAW